jgi:hypothetical protein
MGYEIVINLDKTNQDIIDTALKNNCERYYENYEISGIRRTIHKKKYILTLIFPDEQKYLIKFIEYIKKIKRATIETISYDNCVFHILYPLKKCKISENKKFEKIFTILK